MSSLPPKLASFIQDCEGCESREIRFEYLIDVADRFTSVPERIATRPFPESHRVPACESDAYVWAEKNPDNTIKFYFAVENPQGLSAKSLAVILDESLSGLTLSEIESLDRSVVYQIFGSSLSMGKGLGLTGIVGAVKSEARRVSS